MTAMGSVASKRRTAPGFMARRRFLAFNTGKGQSNPRASSSISSMPASIVRRASSCYRKPMPLFTKAPFQGKVERLLVGADRGVGLEKSDAPAITLSFAGIAGDCHSGLIRKSDTRTLRLYRRDTQIRNVRQLSLLSMEELAEVAAAMRIPEVKPEWVGANLVTSGIPDLTLLSPSTRLQFPSGATLVVDLENAPCRFVADVIAKHYAEAADRWIKAATHKRGVTAWVEREGEVRRGDAITLFLPPQRLYAHG